MYLNKIWAGKITAFGDIWLTQQCYMITKYTAPFSKVSRLGCYIFLIVGRGSFKTSIKIIERSWVRIQEEQTQTYFKRPTGKV